MEDTEGSRVDNSSSQSVMYNTVSPAEEKSLLAEGNVIVPQLKEIL